MPVFCNFLFFLPIKLIIIVYLAVHHSIILINGIVNLIFFFSSSTPKLYRLSTFVKLESFCSRESFWKVSVQPGSFFFFAGIYWNIFYFGHHLLQPIPKMAKIYRRQRSNQLRGCIFGRRLKYSRKWVLTSLGAKYKDPITLHWTLSLQSPSNEWPLLKQGEKVKFTFADHGISLSKRSLQRTCWQNKAEISYALRSCFLCVWSCLSWTCPSQGRLGATHRRNSL